MKHQNKLRLAWFGLQKRETERYLSKCDALYDSEAEQLEALIQSEKTLNKKLRQELDQKTSLLHKNKQEHSDGFADLLLRRLDHSVEALRRQGEAERKRLLALMEKKRNEQGGKRAGMDQQLAEIKDTFDKLLAEASRLVANLKEEGKPPISIEDGVSDLAVLSDPIELAEEENGELAEDGMLEQNEQGESEFAFGANVIQFRLKSILDSLQAAEPEQTMVTADGAPAPVILREHASKNNPGPKQAETALRTKYETAGPIGRNIKAASSDFWGDMSLYMTDGYVEPEGAAASLLSETPPAIAIVPEKPAAFARNERELAEAQAAPSVSEQVPKPKAAPTGSAASEETEMSAASPALAEEIKSIQYRYIAGKAAGENLYGADGTLIIGKGEIITAETINRAERAGKMPDLIVQMIIPGFEEPS